LGGFSRLQPAGLSLTRRLTAGQAPVTTNLPSPRLALAHYRLGELDKAREAFTRATGGAADAFADDALYALGTCDHAEALTSQDPKEAVGKVEDAMRLQLNKEYPLYVQIEGLVNQLVQHEREQMEGQA